MGIIDFGIPEKETEWLRNSMNLDTAVEGGTYQGGTAQELGRDFKVVYTIEKSEEMFGIAKQRLSGAKNIKQLLGDTRDYLPDIVALNDSILFWLDAHWSGGNTYGESDECPLLQELDIIFSSGLKNFAILIDDARLFLAPPPLPHDFKVWPSIKDICQAVPSNYDVIVHNDVIYILPINVEMRAYMQETGVTGQMKSSESVYMSISGCLRSVFRRAIGFLSSK